MNSFFRGSLCFLRSVVKPSSPSSSSGSALVLVLLITALLATVAVSFLSTSRIEQIAAKNFTRQNAASGLAEMATQQAMANIALGFNLTGNLTNGLTGNYTTVVTTQPGAIQKYIFQNGSVTRNATVELFSAGNMVIHVPSTNATTEEPLKENVTTNGTANLNNLQNPGNSIALTNQWTITGNASERINVPMENITVNGSVVGRIAFYVDDEGTKLNLNSAAGNRTTLNAAQRPLDIRALSANYTSIFESIISGTASSNTSDITAWGHFFRPEQFGAAINSAGGNFSADDLPWLSTAASAANTTANMTHLLTPWGTQRIEINTLSTNATNGDGDASVGSIFETLTGLNATSVSGNYTASNSTYGLTGRGLQDVFGGNFSTKYTPIGVKQIAANMLQMRDPNTATVNASFNYQGPLIGSRSLNAYAATPWEASASIPQEYLGYAPYPVISEVSADVGYINNAEINTYAMPYIMINVELYNPYPVAFNASNATLEYCIRGLTWNMTHSIISTGQTYGPYRYGGYGNWTDSTSSKEWCRNFSLRNAGNLNTQFPEDDSFRDNPYGIRSIQIPAYSKKKYTLYTYGWFSSAVFKPSLIFPFDRNDIKIESITDVRCTITYIKITANSTIALRLGGNHNINPNTIRDWVTGADVGPFIPNNGNLSVAGGGGGTSYQDQGVYKLPPANTTTSFPRNVGLADFLTPCNPISAYSYQRLCPLTKTSMSASANLTDTTRSWTINASTANQTFGNRTFSTNITTANQTEQLNDTNANPNFDSGNTIPSDPSYNNFNGNAIYANATESSDMRIPELPSFSGNYFYTSPSDLGLVPTNQRWRRLRMQMQPSAEGSMIPDWAMLEVISFGNSTDPNNAYNRMNPVNINGRFYLPGSVDNDSPPAPRTIGVKALAQVLSLSGDSSIQNPVSHSSPTYPLTSSETLRFKGNSTSTQDINDLVGNISNMTWSANSSWGQGNFTSDPGSKREASNFPVGQYILPSEIMEISGVADAITPSYTSNSSHFKRNEGRASALIPAVSTRSTFFTIYAYAQALDSQQNIESEALTKTLVEVQYDSSTTPPSYQVKKLYTQPIPMGQ